MYVPALFGVNLLLGMVVPFILIVAVALLFVLYFIVISFPISTSLIGLIVTVVLIFITLNVVVLYPAV